MVIKVDFDLTNTVLAYNRYRLVVRDLPSGCGHRTAMTQFESLLATGADIRLDADRCQISLKKKRNLPALLAALAKTPCGPVPSLEYRRIAIDDATRT